MRRFNSNRWWTLVLALVLSVASVAAFPAMGHAGKGTDGTIGSSTPGGTYTPPPQGSGDPDSPSGSGSPQSQLGSGMQTYGITPTAGVGDADVWAPMTIWQMRVRLALGALKYFFLR